MGVFLTTVGQEVIADYVDDTRAPGTHQIGAGTGAGAAGVGSTDLSTEVAEARVDGVKSQPTTRTNRLVGTQSYTGTKTITNAAWFTEATAVCLVIGDGLSIAVQSGYSVEYTFDLLWKDNSE